CGMTLSTATYSFGNTSSTLTIGWYRNGKKYALAGCTGTYRIELTAGNVGRVHFTFIGKIVDDADVAILAPTFPTTVPPEWANASGLTFDSTSPKVSRLTFDAGVETVMREDPADPTGYVASWIVDRAATATMDPEDVLVGDYDWLTKIKNSTEASLVAVVGTAANNTITITAAKAQPVSATPSDRNKIATLDVTLNLNTAFTILFG
ncbi:MAG TPA: hypothetical protein VEA69_19530, partial [Tepidisphaeraceae bacterium]|nr:hypothetical protein [Tepidisphaeraceae bacterium]